MQRSWSRSYHTHVHWCAMQQEHFAEAMAVWPQGKQEAAPGSGRSARRRTRTTAPSAPSRSSARRPPTGNPAAESGHVSAALRLGTCRQGGRCASFVEWHPQHLCDPQAAARGNRLESVVPQLRHPMPVGGSAGRSSWQAVLRPADRLGAHSSTAVRAAGVWLQGTHLGMQRMGGDVVCLQVCEAVRECPVRERLALYGLPRLKHLHAEACRQSAS